MIGVKAMEHLKNHKKVASYTSIVRHGRYKRREYRNQNIRRNKPDVRSGDHLVATGAPKGTRKQSGRIESDPNETKEEKKYLSKAKKRPAERAMTPEDIDIDNIVKDNINGENRRDEHNETVNNIRNETAQQDSRSREIRLRGRLRQTEDE